MSSGGSAWASSAENWSTVSLARFDSSPAPPTTGKAIAATTRPATTHSPMSFNIPVARATNTVRTPLSTPQSPVQCTVYP
ncbi:hypothetical protein GCM10010452_76520 [Crossiella cryophila]